MIEKNFCRCLAEASRNEAYRLYYRTLDEAAAKVEDMSLLRQAHQYLVQLPKQNLTGENFRRSLAESEFYQRL